MEAILIWCNTYWWAVALAAGLLFKVLNKITPRFEDKKGVLRFLLVCLDVLDVIKLSGSGTRRATAILILFLVPAVGCSSWQKTTRTALDAAYSGSQAAERVALPIFKVRCEADARACAAADDQDCQSLKDCQADKHKAQAALDTIDATLAAGYTALALGQEGESTDKLRVALLLLEDLQRILKSAGVLP